MQVIKGKFNDISAELKAQIPPMGKEMVFQMLNGQRNPDPDAEEQRRKPMIYPKQNIPMTDRIKDVDGSWKDMIVAESWSGDKPNNPRFFMAGLDLYGIFNGKFSLSQGNAEDEELYEYLMVSNYTENSILGKNRDTTKQPLVKYLDLKAASTVKTKSLDTLREALNIAKDMSVKEAKIFNQSINGNQYVIDEELLAAVGDFARSKPEDFIKIYNDPNKELRGVVKQALDLNIIGFDMQTGQVRMGENILTTINEAQRANALAAITSWIDSAKNGAEVLKSIKAQLKKKPQLEAA